jgi:hypothetical protein
MKGSRKESKTAAASRSGNVAAGYSGTPLAKKLGIGAGARVLLLDAPEDLAQWLAPLPEGVEFVAAANRSVDLAHVFVKSRVRLARCLAEMRKRLRADAALWISWPKKASGVTTDVSEDGIRELALPLGFVDVKVCAVSAIWSGLKLVVRKELR